MEMLRHRSSSIGRLIAVGLALFAVFLLAMTFNSHGGSSTSRTGTVFKDNMDVSNVRRPMGKIIKKPGNSRGKTRVAKNEVLRVENGVETKKGFNTKVSLKSSKHERKKFLKGIPTSKQSTAIDDLNRRTKIALGSKPPRQPEKLQAPSQSELNLKTQLGEGKMQAQVKTQNSEQTEVQTQSKTQKQEHAQRNTQMQVPAKVPGKGLERVQVNVSGSDKVKLSQKVPVKEVNDLSSSPSDKEAKKFSSGGRMVNLSNSNGAKTTSGDGKKAPKKVKPEAAASYFSYSYSMVDRSYSDYSYSDESSYNESSYSYGNRQKNGMTKDKSKHVVTSKKQPHTKSSVKSAKSG